MSAQAQRPPREEVAFPPNIPVTVDMKFAQPKLLSGQYGERYLFSTSDNRVYFLDPPVAGQIEALGINVRESFTITKCTSGRQGDPISWQVARLGEQRDGTHAMPRDPDAEAPAAKPMARAESSLVADANALVDAYAVVLDRALTTYQGRVKPDEVRALLITAHISRSRGAA